ncbi:EAL and HDOD domain-containing protein [Cellulomonas marina]|uniref:EAL and modified HD-GYP domain-containing signal transduction protein n=1 Tax=Cellulomonas marina TaxID=988821 RepID=A0A1I0WIN3_9CELL|nr:HDOD domain-containing protein [Cellulomonas marina]GIG27685.1 hypothetical protein Cma02nite_02850 [Cellulomonas marina]SFA88612.1 EAL and modified HD-GYP domain-containing signal transduction protein [Cellulomonas marina]
MELDVAALPVGSQVVCVARQAIYDAHRRVRAQELLFRPDPRAVVAGEGAAFDDDVATARVISAVTTEFDPRDLAGDVPLFVNLPRRFLTLELPVPLDPAQVVLEVLERVEPDEAVVRGIEALRAVGFRIAIDDVVPGDRRAGLLPLADFAKVDLRDVPPGGLPAMVDWLRAGAGRPVELVAERIETEQDLADAVAAGFDLFQGYHLRRPSVVARTSLHHSATTALRLLAQLADPRVSFPQITELVSADPALALKALRACNSVAGARHGVRTLHQALVMLGRERLSAMLVLELVGSSGHADDDLAVRCLARTAAAELLAPEDPRAAATEQVVRLVSELLGEDRTVVEGWFAWSTPEADVTAACDALDAYLRAEEADEVPDIAPPHTALRVSTAYLAGVRRARSVLGALGD